MSQPHIPQRSDEPAPAQDSGPLPAIYPTLPPEEPTAGPEPIYTGLAGPLEMKDDRSERQCSLAELLVLVTLAAVGLSGLSLIPGGLQAPRAAGVVGVAALVGLIVLSIFRPRRFVVHLGWWLLMGAYVATCAMAVLRSQ